MDGDGGRPRGGNFQRDTGPKGDVRAAGTGIVHFDGQDVVASPEDVIHRNDEVIGAIGIAVAGSAGCQGAIQDFCRCVGHSDSMDLAAVEIKNRSVVDVGRHRKGCSGGHGGGFEVGSKGVGGVGETGRWIVGHAFTQKIRIECGTGRTGIGPEQRSSRSFPTGVDIVGGCPSRVVEVGGGVPPFRVEGDHLGRYHRSRSPKEFDGSFMPVAIGDGNRLKIVAETRFQSGDLDRVCCARAAREAGHGIGWVGGAQFYRRSGVREGGPREGGAIVGGNHLQVVDETRDGLGEDSQVAADGAFLSGIGDSAGGIESQGFADAVFHHQGGGSTTVHVDGVVGPGQQHPGGRLIIEGSHTVVLTTVNADDVEDLAILGDAESRSRMLLMDPARGIEVAPGDIDPVHHQRVVAGESVEHAVGGAGRPVVFDDARCPIHVEQDAGGIGGIGHRDERPVTDGQPTELHGCSLGHVVVGGRKEVGIHPQLQTVRFDKSAHCLAGSFPGIRQIISDLRCREQLDVGIRQIHSNQMRHHEAGEVARRLGIGARHVFDPFEKRDPACGDRSRGGPRHEANEDGENQGC